MEGGVGSGCAKLRGEMALVPPYIESLRAYEAGRGVEEIQRE
jgi:hypothetical protein